MIVDITTLPAARVACLRHIGPYGRDVSRFWATTFLPWAVAHGLEHAPRYGIAHDNPGLTEPRKCRYDACAEVPDSFAAKSPASIAILPGGRYAVAPYKGNGPDIAAAWTELMRDWLPASGMQVDDRPVFEHYPADAHHDPATGVFECRLCLPVWPM